MKKNKQKLFFLNMTITKKQFKKMQRVYRPKANGGMRRGD